MPGGEVFSSRTRGWCDAWAAPPAGHGLLGLRLRVCEAVRLGAGEGLRPAAEGLRRTCSASEAGLLTHVDAMVPTHSEYAVDVMPLTQVVIDSAAATAQPWRIPLPGGPSRGPSPMASRLASMSRRPVTTA